MILINSSTRQFTIPGADLIFGVEDDSNSEIKEFQCPRYVGNNLDLMGCFIRMNYRNANGDIDSYLVEDISVDGDNVVFSWVLTPNVTKYKGNLTFVMCVVGPDNKVKWHTTLGRGQVLEGLEPDNTALITGTVDAVAQLVGMVEAQTAAVEAEGDKQIKAVRAASEAAEAAAVAEIEAKGVNTRNSIPDDYTALQNAVDALNHNRAGAIVCEVAGSVVAVSDASNLPMQGMKIFGRSTQDGTPTPEAPVEIVSVENPVVTVAGKNLLPYPYDTQTTNINGVDVTVNANGTITLNGTATAGVWFSIASGFDLPAGVYAVKVFPDNWESLYGYAIWTGNGGYFNKFNTTLNETTTCNLGVTLYKGAVVNNVVLTPQIEVGSVFTEYEPPKGKTVHTTLSLPGIPVTSGGNYTDSDGQQWICDEVDLERGVYVRRLFFEKMTDFTKATSYTYDGVGTSCAVAIVDSVAAHTALCSHFVISHKATTTDRFNLIGKTVYFKLAGELSWEEWVDRMSELSPTVVGVLDTPIETALSETEIAAYRALHSNYPNTTVLNDAGAHMVVKYAADTKLYIDNKIAALIGG